MNEMKKCFFNGKHELRILWTIALALISFFVLFAVFGILDKSKIFYLNDNGAGFLVPLVNRSISKLFSLIGVLIPSLIVLRYIEKRPIKLLGLSFNKSSLREHLIGVLIGVCLLIIGALIYCLAGIGEFRLNETIDYQIPYYLLCILVFFVSAAYEEIFFRGYIFQKIIEGTNYWIAQLFVAIFFGLAHLDTEGFTIGSIINAVLAGFLLGHLYFTTRSLWMPIGLHWSWNILMGPIFGLDSKPFFKHTLLTFEKNTYDSAFLSVLENNLFIAILIVIIVVFHCVKIIKPIDSQINPWSQYPSRIHKHYILHFKEESK